MNQSVKSVRLNRFSKLTRLAPVGMSVLELRVPCGLNAADATNRIGNSAKMQAPMATR